MRGRELATTSGFVGLGAVRRRCREIERRLRKRVVRFAVMASTFSGLYLGSFCAQATYLDSDAFIINPGTVTVELFLVNAIGGVGPFASLGATDFYDFVTPGPVSTWSSTWVNPTYLLLTGATPTSGTFYNFDLNLLGAFTTSDGSEKFTVDALFYDGAAVASNWVGVGTRTVDSSGAVSAGSGAPGTLGIQFSGDTFFQVSFDRTPFSVPEPATLALVGLGLAGLGFSRRRSH